MGSEYDSTLLEYILPDSDEHKDFLDTYILGRSENWVIDEDLHRLFSSMIDNWQKENPNRDPNQSDYLKGDLGEVYVQECLKRQLYQLGFEYSYKSFPMTFRMRYQYPKAKGIDIYLRCIDEDYKVYRIYIEVSNWKKWNRCSENLYLNKIQIKFLRWDWRENTSHISCINRRNVRLIQKYADRYNTYIIPLNEHITPEFLEGLTSKKMLSKKYIAKYLKNRQYG